MTSCSTDMVCSMGSVKSNRPTSEQGGSPRRPRPNSWDTWIESWFMRYQGYFSLGARASLPKIWRIRREGQMPALSGKSGFFLCFFSLGARASRPQWNWERRRLSKMPALPGKSGFFLCFFSLGARASRPQWNWERRRLSKMPALPGKAPSCQNLPPDRFGWPTRLFRREIR